MQSHPIYNADSLCSMLKELLANDIEYLKSHPNSKYPWGNHSSTMSAKFNQFDELITLPLFDQLFANNYQMDKIFLYYIKPHASKAHRNIDFETKVLTNASIIIPIDYTPNSSYLWYNPNYVKPNHTALDFPELFKTHGIKIIEGSQVFEPGTPLLVEHQNAWAGIYNKENSSQFVFLQLTLKDNPSYEEIKSIF